MPFFFLRKKRVRQDTPIITEYGWATPSDKSILRWKQAQIFSSSTNLLRLKGSSFSRCKDDHFRVQTTRPIEELQDIGISYCTAASTTQEMVPETAQEWKILLNGATKGETLEHVFVQVAWWSNAFPARDSAWKQSSILKTFKVTKHDLSIIASSPPSLLEAGASSQLAKLVEIVHPRSQSWQEGDQPCSGSCQERFTSIVLMRAGHLTQKQLQPQVPEVVPMPPVGGVRWRQEHHWGKKKKCKRNKNSQNKRQTKQMAAVRGGQVKGKWCNLIPEVKRWTRKVPRGDHSIGLHPQETKTSEFQAGSEQRDCYRCLPIRVLPRAEG